MVLQPPDMIGTMIDELVNAISTLSDVEIASLADSDTIVELHRQLARLEAITTRATARWDADQRWADDGARSPSSWIAHRCHIPSSIARRRVRLGRELRHLPRLEEAWSSGDLSEPHVAAMVARRTPATAEAMERDEAMLVDHASRLTFREFSRALAYWHQFADPDGVEVDAAKLHDDRRLSISQTFENAWVGDFVLDPIGGSAMSAALRAIEQELFEHDWAAARARLGRDPVLADLPRSPAQRRADALVEMATRAMTAPRDGRRPEPLFTVLVDYETLAGRICELADRTTVTPGSLVPWLDRAWVERIVFDGPSRVVDVGVRRRLFTGAIRRAIEVRDRECYHELCDEPAHRCQVDHIDPHAWGGLTEQDNGRLACAYHNRLRNRRPLGP
jgi:hypothetical protein